jgi:CheY-like chemotaxis protein
MEFMSSGLAAPATKLILHVDDDENFRKIINDTVTLEGFQIVSVASGPVASEALKARKADLIISDLMMPGQAGTAFLRGLHPTPHAKTPVFVITGLMLEPETVATIRKEANIVEFINKPVQMPNFIAALHKHLRTAPISAS